jgi:predicted lipoprotein
MMKKAVKYILAIILVLFIASNSIYLKKLSDVKASAAKQFDAAKYARNYLTTQLIPAADKAPQADDLLTLLKSSPDTAFKMYSHGLDIGNIRFFMVRGQGTVTAVDENDIYIVTKNKEALKIAIEYVFGNALRDAPGLININDFTNTMDLNNIAAEVDKIVRAEVLPPIKSKIKTGDKLTFAGAFELNQEHINLNKIEIIPIILKIDK